MRNRATEECGTRIWYLPRIDRASRHATGVRPPNMKPSRSVSFLLLVPWVGLVAFVDEPSRSVPPFFEDQVLPVLEDHCFRCHGERKKVKGGLRLTSREGILEGGDRGPAVDLAAPDSSLLLKMIRYTDPDHQMPPKGKLEEAELAILARWVDQRLPWGDEVDYGAEVDEDPADEIAPWPYGPVVRPTVPEVRGAGWGRNPIDAFVMARLEAADVPPAAPADAATLLRRVTFDLTGLPPTPAEVTAFVVDPSDAAYEAVIDRLLASPHYGELQARHWLDLVRYAETNGFERDTDKPFIWRYRDWVIDAFNDDLPYDRFVIEQLAGDELDDVTPSSLVATGYQRLMQWDDEPGQGVLQARYDTLDDLVSTTSQAFLGATIGCARCHDHKKDPIPQADYYRFMAFFHGLTDLRIDGPLTDIPTDEERARHGRLVAVRDADLAALEAAVRERSRERGDPLLTPSEDGTSAAGAMTVASDGPVRFVLEGGGERARLTVDGVALLGPGVAREQTHDLAAGTVEVRLHDVDPNAAPPRLWWVPLPAGVDGASDGAPAPDDARRPLTLEAAFGEAGPHRDERERIRRRDLPIPRAFAVAERGGEPEPLHVHIRGSAHALGELVRPAYPAFLAPTASPPQPTPRARSSGRRRALAEWIASDENPMTARVMANRIWLHHFGRGIVKTPNDFGALGEGSTHPALLDWLAAEFVARGWSVKRMHRLILTSATYRMSSHATPSALANDPSNLLFSRFALRRLSAEEMRDTMIAMTGRLNPTMGGPPFYSRMPAEALATSSRPDAAWGTSPEAETFRRSIYIKVKRSLLTPLLAALDLADTDQSCPVRFTTTQPTQALTMVNGEFVHEMAARFAARLREEVGDDPDAQVRRALALAIGREATDDELTSHLDFIDQLDSEDGVDALALFCLVVLNLNEFAYVA